MRKARRSPSRSNLLLVAALALFAGACSSTSIFEYITVAPLETQVWNDAMPGSKPQCNAVLRVVVANISEQPVTLSDPEAIIVDAPSLMPLRRYPAMVSADEHRVRQVTVQPGDTVEIAFRSPSYGLKPIDIAQHPKVRIAVRMQSSLDLPFLFRSPVTELFKTQ